MSNSVLWPSLFVSIDAMRWSVRNHNPANAALIDRLAHVVAPGDSFDLLKCTADAIGVPSPFNVNRISADWVTCWRIIQLGTAHAENIAQAIALTGNRSVDLTVDYASDPVSSAAVVIVRASIERARLFGPDHLKSA